jgi:hypothetical protein
MCKKLSGSRIYSSGYNRNYSNSRTFLSGKISDVVLFLEKTGRFSFILPLKARWKFRKWSPDC